jgi:hypothetical protein
MCTTLVLKVFDLNKTFVVELNASSTGIRAVLTQDGRPLVFTFQALSGHNLGKSMYEKKMMTILHVVHTWKQYLLGCCFHIKTNHHSLKYFLEKQLFSP